MIYLRFFVVSAFFVLSSVHSSAEHWPNYKIKSYEKPLEIINAKKSYASGIISRDEYVEELRKVITSRPNNPENISLEFEMGVVLSQYTDSKHNQGVKKKEGLEVYEHILKTYRHMDYYQFENAVGAFCPDLAVPASAIYAGDEHIILSRDTETAKQDYLYAMECLRDTYEQRIQDWKNEPPPQIDPYDRDGEVRYKENKAVWDKRQAVAYSGEIFEPDSLEALTASTAVQQYLIAFAPLHPEDVPSIMGVIIQRFPNTPMAKYAQKYIDKASRMQGKKIAEDIFTNLVDFPVKEVTQATASGVPSTKSESGTALTPINKADSISRYLSIITIIIVLSGLIFVMYLRV